MSKKGLVLIVFAWIFWADCVFAGSFVDDWIQQKTSTGPNYFETQKRGFGTFGSASMRWRTGNDYISTVSKPSFKSGCGGIDLFLGGFSFLKFDQLVKKFQSILGPNAAAFAFDIAMSVLSSQASESMKSLSAMIDRLNQLQFDDCQASKALVYTVADAFDPKQFAKQKSDAVKDFTMIKGVQDLYSSVVDFGKTVTTKKAMENAGAGQESQEIAGCPQDLKDIFFEDGYILDHLSAKKGYTTNHAALMRGIVGDVQVLKAELNFAYVDRCPQNDNKNMDSFINGDVYYRPAGSTNCQKLATLTIDGFNYASVHDWTFNVLESIATKISTKSGALTPSEEYFVSVMPMPIFTAIETMVAEMGSSQAVTVANTFADFTATVYVYNMLSDFYAAIDSAFRAARTAYANSQGSASGTNQETCKVDLAAPALANLESKKQDLTKLLAELNKDYNRKFTELEASMSMTQGMINGKNRYQQKMAHVVSAGVANKILN